MAVIKIENLWKEYRLGVIGHGTLTHDLQSWWAKVRGKEDPNSQIIPMLTGQEKQIEGDRFWALRDINLEVQQGEILGIIGKNGAGKSTLLKILSRVTAPTKGKVKVKGRIASLLEVGTGFHPELTGRENIFMNGAILGMSKQEIKSKIDEIIDFSGIESYVDTPAKRYSSGMRVRLAFAVAAHLEPEILVIDEVLAVGDVAFQRKCVGKMQEVSSVGRTILFVSHQLDMITALCDRCILIGEGAISLDGKPEIIVRKYNELFTSDHYSASFRCDEDNSVSIQIVNGRLVGRDNIIRHRFDVFEPIIIELEYIVHQPIEGQMVNFEVKRNGVTLFLSFDTDRELEHVKIKDKGKYVVRVQLPCPLLKPGHYSITFGTGIANLGKIQHLESMIKFEIELLSEPSSLVSYADKRPGLLAVPLQWDTVSYK